MKLLDISITWKQQVRLLDEARHTKTAAEFFEFGRLLSNALQDFDLEDERRFLDEYLSNLRSLAPSDAEFPRDAFLRTVSETVRFMFEQSLG